MSITKKTESLQLRSQAMAFARSSSGNKPLTVKEEVGFNFQKTFRKPNEKLTRLIKATIYALGVGVRFILVEPV